MFSFFKKKQETQVPQWADFFSPKEYAHFIKSIDQYFKSRSMSYQMFDGWVEVEESAFGLNKLGLVNVAQNCKQNHTTMYEEIIIDHFESLVRANKFNEEFERNIGDFDYVKPYIGVRLYDDGYFKQVGIENTIGAYLTDEIYSTLIFDLPDSINNVKPEQAEKWGKDKSELMNLGIKNIKQKYDWHVSEEQFDKFKIWFIQSDHFFAPNIVFELENRKDLLSENGVIIGIPHRHAVIIYPIKTLDTIEAINRLIPVIYGMHQEGPGSLTNKLYFYKDGEFMDLPYEIDNDKIQFYPPEEFVEILNELK